MSGTPLGTAVVTYKEAGIDVRWRDFEDFTKWCVKLGVDLGRTPKAYGKVPAGTETAHYRKIKDHLEDQAKKMGRVSFAVWSNSWTYERACFPGSVLRCKETFRSVT
jgi:hypothetical protein